METFFTPPYGRACCPFHLDVIGRLSKREYMLSAIPCQAIRRIPFLRNSGVGYMMLHTRQTEANVLSALSDPPGLYTNVNSFSRE